MDPPAGAASDGTNAQVHVEVLLCILIMSSMMDLMAIVVSTTVAQGEPKGHEMQPTQDLESSPGQPLPWM